MSDPIIATYDRPPRYEARIGEVIDLTAIDTEMRPDPPSHPHAEASPRSSLKVLRNLISTCRARGVTQLDINVLDQYVTQQEAKL